MDFLPSVDELQDHLMAHDKAIRQIIVLDAYIERLSEQTFIATMGEQMAPAFQKMIRVGVAEGVKRMFKEYRLMKWLKVQEMAATVRQILTQEIIESQENEGLDNNPQDIVHPEYDRYQSAQIQAENQPWQLAAPETYNWEPVTDNWTASPRTEPSLQHLVSPITTPNQSTPYQTAFLNQSGIQESPFGIRTQTNRQLFPDNQSSAHCDSEDCDTDEDQSGDNASENLVNQSNNAIHGHQVFYPTIGNTEQASGQDRFTESSVEPVSIGQTYNQPIVGEPANFHDVQMGDHVDEVAEMDWDDEEDEFDDSYDEDDENLAGVLFAAERLLPDEQTARLDVEMGDMGVGHMLFDRVSATWYTAECEFYRAD